MLRLRVGETPKKVPNVLQETNSEMCHIRQQSWGATLYRLSSVHSCGTGLGWFAGRRRGSFCGLKSYSSTFPALPPRPRLATAYVTCLPSLPSPSISFVFCHLAAPPKERERTCGVGAARKGGRLAADLLSHYLLHYLFHFEDKTSYESRRDRI